MSKHRIHPDSKIIDRLGGPTKLAQQLNYGKGGAQRVQNWRDRGIPSKVKLERPDLFLTDLADRVRAIDDAQPPVGESIRTEKRKGSGSSRKTKESRARL